MKIVENLCQHCRRPGWYSNCESPEYNHGGLVCQSSNSIQFTDSCHPDEGGANFLWNVGSYKSHTA
jgi:hypothetical protein